MFVQFHDQFEEARRMIRSYLIFASIAVVSLVEATNFCDRNLCSGRSHIGCGNNGAYGSRCPSGTSMVDMTTALKNAIVNSHNTKRNTIAAGNLSRFKPAERMATMRWNDELAKLAAFNVKRCIFGHDECHNTDLFGYSGQNIAKNWWSGGSQSDSAIIMGQIDSWWSEHRDTTMTNINSYPSSSSKQIGHFTVMAADKNIAVGCAAIKFRDSGMKNWYSLTLACNYGTTNMIGRPIYAAGATATKCTTGKNPNYLALCSPSERYDLNKF